MSSKPRPADLAAALPGLRRIVLRFAPYLRRERPLIAGSVGALLTVTALRLLEPWPLKFVIDRLVGAGTFSPRAAAPVHAAPVEAAPASAAAASDVGLLAELMTMSTSHLIPACALALVLIVGLKAGAEYLTSIGFSLVGNRVMTAVREDLFRHLQRLSLGFHVRRRAGDLTLRLLGDVGMLKETLVTAALPLLASVLVLLGMVIVMLLLNWRLALVALLPLPLLWLSGQRISRRIRDASRTQRSRESAMAASAAESLTAIRTVQAMGLEQQVAAGFSGANRKSLRDGVKAGRLAAALERSVDVLVAGATALVLWYGANEVLRGKLTPGDLLVFLTYFKNSMRPARDYAKYSGRLAKASAAGERIIELLDEEPAVRDRADARAAPPLSGQIRFEQVSFAYGPVEPSVLNELDLEVRAGEHLAITGASGAGKSTITSLLLRLYDPDRGRITVDGHDIRDLTLASLRQQIDLVPQDTVLFAASLHDNIALAAGREVSRDEVEQAARLANAHDFIERLPEGYDTVIGERGATLSNGQRQRIAVARAALRQGPLLVLDEATVGLDMENTVLVTEALARLAHGRTCLVITHDLGFAARADRIVHLEGGQIAEAGDHASLMARNGRYAALWRLQQGDAAAPGPATTVDSSTAALSRSGDST